MTPRVCSGRNRGRRSPSPASRGGRRSREDSTRGNHRRDRRGASEHPGQIRLTIALAKCGLSGFVSQSTKTPRGSDDGSIEEKASPPGGRGTMTASLTGMRHFSARLEPPELGLARDRRGDAWPSVSSSRRTRPWSNSRPGSAFGGWWWHFAQFSRTPRKSCETNSASRPVRVCRGKRRRAPYSWVLPAAVRSSATNSLHGVLSRNCSRITGRSR